jgi:hypothetical protein
MSGKKPAAGIRTLWLTFKKTRDYSPASFSKTCLIKTNVL